MNETTKPSARDFQATMNAVIISDDVTLAGKVHSLLDDAAHRTQESSRWHVSSWRPDQLMFPPSEKSVLNAAGEAHVIVLAVRGQGGLPSRLIKWVNIWAEHRRERGTLHTTFEGGNTGSSPTQEADELSKNVVKQELRFSSEVPISAGGEAGIFAGNPDVAPEMPAPTTNSSFKPAFLDGFRDWGLNE